MIDGIMMEDKKEVDKVILTGAELGKYFEKETTPREMKDQIIKLLGDWKGQQKPLFLNDSVPEEHKAGIDMRRDLLRRSHVLLVCGGDVDEDVKNDIAVAGQLGIAATTLDGILAVKGLGKDGGRH